MEEKELVYNLAGWYIVMPGQWQYSVDAAAKEPQPIYEAMDGRLVIYASEWSFYNEMSDQAPSPQEVLRFFTTASRERRMQEAEWLAPYYPTAPGLAAQAYIGFTSGGYPMINFGIASAGRLLLLYFVGRTEEDCAAYYQYVKKIRRAEN